MSEIADLLCFVLGTAGAIAFVSFCFKAHFDECERVQRWSDARCRERGWISDHT